jgi:hypothetical protein
VAKIVRNEDETVDIMGLDKLQLAAIGASLETTYEDLSKPTPGVDGLLLSLKVVTMMNLVSELLTAIRKVNDGEVCSTVV